jgi:hypothetical protein
MRLLAVAVRPADVFLGRDWFEVLWVHAQAVAAEVIHLEARWDWADVVLPGPPVSGDLAVLTRHPPAPKELPITLALGAADPLDAARLREGDIVRESVEGGSKHEAVRESHVRPPPG